MLKALLRRFNLNQKKKIYFNFEEIREIERDLSKNVSTSSLSKLVKNLKDKTLRILIRALIN
jgi:ADP-heptose:LPS heptosyltransferase